MRNVCLSDIHSKTHGMPPVPEGDVLVVAGDITMSGAKGDIKNFNQWLENRPHNHKVVIAGNHDWAFYRNKKAPSWIPAATYLQDSGVTIDGVKFWGSPWQPEFLDWAFNLPRGKSLREKWDLIPDDTDVLLTHGPPAGILDNTARGERVGCVDLLDRVREVKPRLHVFGHIHPSYGVKDEGGTAFVNASICTEAYQPWNDPIVYDI